MTQHFGRRTSTVFRIAVIGLPFLALGWIIVGAIGVWFMVRTIVGVFYLARGEPYHKGR